MPLCIAPYKYCARHCAYKTERFEMSREELKSIYSLPRGPVVPQPYPAYSTKCKIILDTDLGTDIDDAFALLYALRSPEIEIVGITTNCAVSTIRAEAIRKICKSYEREVGKAKNTPIVTGSSRPLGTHRSFRLSGNEGSPLLPREFIASNGVREMNELEQFEASEFMFEVAKAFPHEITIVSIGAPTNIGLLLKNHPECCTLLKEVVIMGLGDLISDADAGGERGERFAKKRDSQSAADQQLFDGLIRGMPTHLSPNHNVSMDVLATQLLFGAKGLRVKIVPARISSQFCLSGEPLRHIQSAAEQADRFESFVCSGSSSCPTEVKRSEAKSKGASEQKEKEGEAKLSKFVYVPSASRTTSAKTSPEAKQTSEKIHLPAQPAVKEPKRGTKPDKQPSAGSIPTVAQTTQLSPKASSAASTRAEQKKLNRIVNAHPLWFRSLAPIVPKYASCSSTALVGLLWKHSCRRWPPFSHTPHDPLTVHEAAFPIRQAAPVCETASASASASVSDECAVTAAATSLTSGKKEDVCAASSTSCILYVPGTVVVHEWAAFTTFVPHPAGNHYLGISLAPSAYSTTHLLSSTSSPSSYSSRSSPTDNSFFMQNLSQKLMQV